MRFSPKQLNGSSKEVLLVTGPPDFLEVLEPWIRTKSDSFEVRIEQVRRDRENLLGDGDPRLDGVDVFAQIVPLNIAPSKCLPGMGLKDRKGKFVFGSLLPLSRTAASRFAQTAGKVETRLIKKCSIGPVLLLGEWEERAAKMSERSRRCLENAKVPCFRWTAERLTREALSWGLECGAGMALYYGHGRSAGWAGYHGFRSRHLPIAPEAPLGAVLSVTCSTACRSSGGFSFAESFVSRGAAAVSLGAVRKTRHLDNAYLASSLCESMAAGEFRLHRALARAHLPEDILYSSYRLFGDPTANVCGDKFSVERANLVYAPSAEAKFECNGQQVSIPDTRNLGREVDLAEVIGL